VTAQTALEPALGSEDGPRAVDHLAGQPEIDREAIAANKDSQSLRQYQLDVVHHVELEQRAGRRRILVVAPTGSGKTVLACEAIRRRRVRGARILVLVHRRELIKQMSQRLHAAGIDHGIIAAGFQARPGEQVQVASIATIGARAMRSRQMELPVADVIVVDESHHATADSWRSIIESFPNAVVIGLTATPCRKGGTGLGDLFETLVEAPQVAKLIAQSYLVGTKVFGPPAGPDLRGIRTRGGDYVESELAARVDTDQIVGDVVTEWFRHNPERRRTIVFATNIAHMVHLRDAFRAQGVLAEGIDGSTPVEERDRILGDLEKGVVEVVVNVGVLTEGFDCPTVGCIIIARPTKSFGLYRQMVGRGLRPADGKDHCIVIDHAGATKMHGFAEEEVDWTLDTKTRAQSKVTAAAKASFHPPELAACPECSAFHWKGRPCQACGWRPQPKAKPVDVIDADLEEMRRDGSRIPLKIDQRDFYRQLLWIGRERGWKPGAPAVNYMNKFGVWPPRSWNGDMPVEPEPATRSWVKSRLIAYAKGRAKAGVA